MRIEVFDQEAGLHGGREVWVRVLANTATDWPTIQSRLSEAQRETMRGAPQRPTSYHPHLVTSEEREEHNYSYEDWWVFKMPETISVSEP